MKDFISAKERLAYPFKKDVFNEFMMFVSVCMSGMFLFLITNEAVNYAN